MITLTQKQLPPQLVAFLSKLSFGQYEKGGTWGLDGRDEWTRAADELQESIYSGCRGLKDQRLAEYEIRQTDKLLCWRDASPGLLAGEEDVFVDNRAQADALAPYLRMIGRKFCGLARAVGGEVLGKWAAEARIPIDRNKGYPLYAPGGLRGVAVALRRLSLQARSFRDLEEIESSLRRWAAPRSTVSTVRIQNKGGDDQPLYAVVNGVLRVVGRGRRPKVRPIRICGWDWNAWLTPPAGVWTKLAQLAALVSVPDLGPEEVPDSLASLYAMRDAASDVLGDNWRYNIAGVKPVAIARTKRHIGSTVVGIDFSAYDDSVSLQTHQAWIDSIWSPFCSTLADLGVLSDTHADIAVWIEGELGRIPSLLPPLRDTDGGRVAEVIGEIRSGKKTTSLEGSPIALATSLYRADAAEIAVEVDDLGDDNRNTIARAFRARAGKFAACKVPGITDKIDTVNIWLKDIQTADGSHMTLSGAAMNTLQKEQRFEPKTPLVAARGIRARRDRLIGHPAAHVFDAWLKQVATWNKAYRVALAASYAPIDTLNGMITRSGAPVDDGWVFDDDEELRDIVEGGRFEELWDAAGLPREPKMCDLDAAAMKLSVGEARALIRSTMRRRRV